jgi:hypothetical protein
VTVLTNDPRGRRIIVPLSAADRLRANDDRALRVLLSSQNVAVIALPVSEETLGDDPVLRALDRAEQLKRNAVLIQNPLSPDGYFDVQNAPEMLAREKYLLAVQLCQHLGATQVDMRQLERTTSSGSTVWNVAAAHGPAVARGAIETTDVSQLVRDLHISHRFAGGAPDGDAAKRLLSDAGLSQDQYLRRLVEMRIAPNPLLRQQIKVNTRTETERMRAWLGQALVLLNRQKLGREASTLSEAEYEFVFDVSF